MQDFSSLILEAEYCINLAYLGIALDKNAKSFLSFSEFKTKQSEYISAPRRPNKPVSDSNNKIKQQVFDIVYRKLIQEHNKKLSLYEKAISQQKLLKQYPNTIQGYAQYLAENSTFATPFLSQKFKIPIKESHRQKHTYITGGTGSGKSEAIKTFIWHYLTRNQSTGLVLLTPHSEIAEQVAKFWVNIGNNRLVYVSPLLAEQYNKYPCINPFDIPNKENLSDIEAERYAEGFREVFEELLQDGFTEQMNALLKNTLPVIIKMPNSSIYDLLDFLEPDGEKVENYIEFANENIKNPTLLRFLNGQFLNDPTYKRTKSALHTRLHSVFSSTVMQAMLKGKTTVNIEQLIDSKKLIIFDFSIGEIPLEWNTLGKFVIASVKMIAFQRSKKEFFTPCHLFIDECQTFITSSLGEILTQCRKFGLYLTLAQQQAGNGMQNELLDSILGNVGVKLTGRNGDINTLNKLAKSTGAEVEDLQKYLETGKFSLWTVPEANEKQKPPTIITMPTNTLDNKQSMTAEQWEIIKNDQINRFYRTLVCNTEKTIQTSPEDENTMNFDDINSYLN